ncbi:hypothetical protein BDY19DRAFT_609070 [Irpex rosettiformis]|uniref:Uncharacterized protein n=1 Tax=Irpex rosettiformis TaxID=378272 RepID=A0ACB8TPD1_9APHY|nr:hypothetical protein BDY19DRAFT_609070 [Irpex rosettiformis]
MAGRWIGPLHPKVFLDSLLPVSRTNLANMPKGVEFTIPRDGKDPLGKEMHEQFAHAIANNNLSPNMEIFIFVDKTNDGMTLRPDAGFEEIHRVIPASPENNGTKAIHKQPKATDRLQAFNCCRDALVVEFKKLADHDPFFRVASEDIVSVVQQHSTHPFQLLIFGQYARFIYFDHGRAIVSERVDYVEDSSLLIEFMWRFNHISNVGKGRDSTTITAFLGEQMRFTSDVFLENMKNPSQLVLPTSMDLTMPGKYPIHNMSVKESDSNTMELPHIPGMICGEYIKGLGDNNLSQSTKGVQWTLRRQDLSVGCANPRDHAHNRMTQRIAYPIEAVTDSKQYIKAFYSAMQVIERACADVGGCSILHKDVTIGSVIINGKDDDADVEVLEDWGHARVLVSTLKEACERQKCNTGTWLFMSVGLLQNWKEVHEILDDFESVLWTELYGALHRFKHTGEVYKEVFTEKNLKMAPYWRPTHILVGGHYKYTLLHTFPQRVAFSCKPLGYLFMRLIDTIREYYAAEYGLRRARSAATRDSDEDSSGGDVDSEGNDKYSSLLSKASEAFKNQHAIVSNPQSWLNIFDSVLDREGWCDDLMPKDPYSMQIENQEAQQIETPIQKVFEASTRSHSEILEVEDEDSDDLEIVGCIYVGDVIEAERDPRIPLIPASEYFRRGLDADGNEPAPQPANVVSPPSFTSPLCKPLEDSGVTGNTFSSESLSTDSISEQRKRKHKDNDSEGSGGKTAGSSESEVRSEPSPMQKRPRRTRAPATSSLPSASDNTTRPQTRLATARQLSGEASVGASKLGHLSISPTQRTQANLKGKDKLVKGKGKRKGKETGRSRN